MSLEHSPSKTGAPLVWTIDEFAQESKLGRSFLYSEIKAGRLKIKKAGRRSLILGPDGVAYLASLPEHEPAATKAA